MAPLQTPHPASRSPFKRLFTFKGVTLQIPGGLHCWILEPSCMCSCASFATALWLFVYSLPGIVSSCRNEDIHYPLFNVEFLRTNWRCIKSCSSYESTWQMSQRFTNSVYELSTPFRTIVDFECGWHSWCGRAGGARICIATPKWWLITFDK